MAASQPRSPVIAGFELDEVEQHLMSYWLEGRDSPLRRVDRAEILRGRGGLLYHPFATEEDLKEILEWNLPLLTVTGKAVEPYRAEFQKRMQGYGAAAIWELESATRTVAPPPVAYAGLGQVYLLDDRQSRRRRYRQLLFYCGYDVRVDFQSGDDLLKVLKEQAANQETMPNLLLLDLGSTRLDGRAFFPALRRLLEEFPDLRRTCGIMLTKDFSRTGADLNLIAAHIRTLTRRIFAPEEALFALLEGLLYEPNFAGIETQRRADRRPAPGPLPLRDLLVGENVSLHESFPALWPDARTELHRRAQLFRWFYDGERRPGGLPLTDSRSEVERRYRP